MQYTCRICGETFESDKPDEEALAEAANKWPGFTVSEMAIVCEGCYKEFMGEEDDN